MRLPIRTRLTLVFAGLMLVVLAGSGALLYVGLASQLDAAINDELESLAEEFAIDIGEGETADTSTTTGLSEPEKSFAQILGATESVIETSRAVADPLLDLVEASSPR